MKQAVELQMTPEEIVRSYREAKDKAAQVGILADLNLCPKEMICKILVEGGVDHRQLPRPRRKKPPTHTEGERMKEEKKKEDAERRAAEAAEIGDVTKEALFYYKETLEREAATLREEFEREMLVLNNRIAVAEKAIGLLA